MHSYYLHQRNFCWDILGRRNAHFYSCCPFWKGCELSSRRNAWICTSVMAWWFDWAMLPIVPGMHTLGSQLVVLSGGGLGGTVLLKERSKWDRLGLWESKASTASSSFSILQIAAKGVSSRPACHLLPCFSPWDNSYPSGTVSPKKLFLL